MSGAVPDGSVWTSVMPCPAPIWSNVVEGTVVTSFATWAVSPLGVGLADGVPFALNTMMATTTTATAAIAPIPTCRLRFAAAACRAFAPFGGFCGCLPFGLPACFGCCFDCALRRVTGIP